MHTKDFFCIYKLSAISILIISFVSLGPTACCLDSKTLLSTNNDVLGRFLFETAITGTELMASSISRITASKSWVFFFFPAPQLRRR